MKKIGIITFHSAHNYGAALQAFALQTALTEKQYDVKIIDFRNKYIDKNFKPFAMREGGLKTKIRSILINCLFWKKNLQRYNAFEEYFKKYYHCTRTVTNEDFNGDFGEGFDSCITGSDQVWNPNLAGGLLDAYTLNWGKKSLNRISYAASVGDISIVKVNKNQFVKKLGVLNHISVRENNLKSELQDILGRQVEVVVDPTLLLDSNIWEKMAVAGPKQKYVFAYAIGNHDNHRLIVNYVSRKMGLPVIQVERRNKYENVLQNRYNAGPNEFLGLLRDAEVVIATSFHATVFALIFHKQFWAVPPKDTGERIYGLLRMVGLENRCIVNPDECDKLDLHEKINFEKVDQIIKEQREKSIVWLQNALDEYKL